MKTRIVFGSLMLAFMVGLLWLDWFLTRDVYSVAAGAWQAAPGAALAVRALPLASLFLLISLLAVAEMRGLLQAAGVRIGPVSAHVCTAAVMLLPFAWQQVPPGWHGRMALVTASTAVLLVFAEQMLLRTAEDALRRVAGTLLCVAYLGFGGAMVMSIRLEFNLPVLVLFLVSVKFMDIGAYFTGSFLGRHKLIPWLSPGKTWEGLAGGTLVCAGAAVLTAAALGVHLGEHPMRLAQAGAFGAIVGLAGQFGDLAESLLKRAANVKDSGRLVPEFGGLLDILDSPLLAAPVGYLLLLAMR